MAGAYNYGLVDKLQKRVRKLEVENKQLAEDLQRLQKERINRLLEESAIDTPDVDNEPTKKKSIGENDAVEEYNSNDS